MLVFKLNHFSKRSYCYRSLWLCSMYHEMKHTCGLMLLWFREDISPFCGDWWRLLPRTDIVRINTCQTTTNHKKHTHPHTHTPTHNTKLMLHDDVIKWKHFLRCWPLWGESIGHRLIPLVKASDAELWCFFLIGAWTNAWANNPDVGDLRRHRAHYDVTLMYVLEYTEYCIQDDGTAPKFPIFIYARQCISLIDPTRLRTASTAVSCGITKSQHVKLKKHQEVQTTWK